MPTREPCPSGHELPDPSALLATTALLNATAHPARLLALIALSRRGELSAGTLAELAGLEQSAMSHQLRVLRDAHLVTRHRSGRVALYTLADAHVAHIVEDALTHALEGPQ